MNVICPHCHGAIALDPSLADQTVNCPHCSGLLMMPAVPTAVAVSPPAAVDSLDPLDFTSGGVTTRRAKKKNPSTIKTVLKWVACIWVCLFIIGGIVNLLDKGKKDKQVTANVGTAVTHGMKRDFDNGRQKEDTIAATSGKTVTHGIKREAVRRLLGKPAQIIPLKDGWDSWIYTGEPGGQLLFDAKGRCVRYTIEGRIIFDGMIGITSVELTRAQALAILRVHGAPNLNFIACAYLDQVNRVSNVKAGFLLCRVHDLRSFHLRWVFGENHPRLLRQWLVNYAIVSLVVYFRLLQVNCNVLSQSIMCLDPTANNRFLDADVPKQEDSQQHY